jgi:hypothetical protein
MHGEMQKFYQPVDLRRPSGGSEFTRVSTLEQPDSHQHLTERHTCKAVETCIHPLHEPHILIACIREHFRSYRFV